jgi:prepilin-type N-terminal cleavage/methylation domain-containing protein
MKQGSNMTVSHRGMRKGISLMEMMVAVILLGILSSVGYNYYKNYFDTSLAAKQIKVAVIIEQGSQLKNALELYRTKFGVDVNSTDTSDYQSTDNGLGLLVAQRIITEIPAKIPDISGTGWANTAPTDGVDWNSTLITAQNGTTANDQVITYKLDSADSTANDRVQYCNALNNIASNGSQTFTVSGSTIALSDGNASAELMENTFFCWDRDQNATDTVNSGLEFLFITKIY